MARFRTLIETAATPARAFAFLEDFTNAADWDPGVAAAERLDEGPIGVGSRFGLDLAVAGRTQRWTYVVEVHDAPRRVVFVTRGSRATGVDAVTVVPTATGSRVEWDAHFGFDGVLGALIDPVFGLVFDRIARRATAGLRDALQALPAHADATA